MYHKVNMTMKLLKLLIKYIQYSPLLLKKLEIIKLTKKYDEVFFAMLLLFFPFLILNKLLKIQKKLNLELTQ